MTDSLGPSNDDIPDDEVQASEVINRWGGAGNLGPNDHPVSIGGYVTMCWHWAELIDEGPARDEAEFDGDAPVDPATKFSGMRGREVASVPVHYDSPELTDDVPDSTLDGIDQSEPVQAEAQLSEFTDDEPTQVGEEPKP